MRLSLTLVASSVLCLGLAQPAAGSPALSRDKSYARCLITQVQLIGGDSSEHHASVLAKGKAKCANFERDLDREMGAARNFGDPAGNWVGSTKDELLERAERAALEALFRARARSAQLR